MLDQDYEVAASWALKPSFFHAPAPPNMQPRLYQDAGVEYVIARDHALIGDEPGVGKTAQGILISNAIGARRTLVICPASLRLNWEREIWQWSTIPNVVTYPIAKASDGVSNQAHYVIVSWAMISSPYILAALMAERWDNCIMDECFPAGTMVATEDGPRDIAKLVNERQPVRVWSMGPRGPRLQRIARYVRTPAPKKLVEIAAGEHYVLCTPNHRVWSEEHGYIRAGDLREGDTIRLREGVEGREQRARAGVEPAQSRAGQGAGERAGAAQGGGEARRGSAHGARGLVRAVQSEAGRRGQPLLRPLVLGEVAHGQLPGSGRGEDGADARQSEAAVRAREGGILGADETPQFRPGVSRQTGRYIEVAPGYELDRPAGRQRTPDGSAAHVAGGAGVAGRPAGVRDLDEGRAGREFADVLQGGPRRPGDEDGHRSGRLQPQHEAVALSGRAEDGGTRLARVDRVALVEQGSDGGPGFGGAEGAWVYNIEVAEDHNYFANGFQVSNCHALKDPKGNKRTKVVCAPDRLPSVVGRFTALSGTISPNQPIEVYNIIRLLDWEAINKASLEDFREHYYDMGGGMVRGPVWDAEKQCLVTKLHFSNEVRNVPRNMDDLQYRLRKNLMVRRLKNDVLTELPPKVWHPFPLAHTSAIKQALKHPGWDDAARLYDMDPDAFEHGIPIDGAISTARRLLGEAKAESVADYIEDLLDSGVQKIVVGALHRSVLAILRSRLEKYGLTYMDGGTSGPNKQKAADQFQNSDKIRIILGQIGVIGEGWTLTVAQDAVLAEPDYVPGRNDQFLDRIHRLGQKGSYLIGHVPVVPGTLDERVISTAVRKDKAIHQMLDAR